MGFFDRIRSGLRSIGERLHILKAAEVQPEQQKEIASLERKIDRMAEEIRPVERRVEEDISAYDTGTKRYSVTIRYRPIGSPKQTRVRTAIVEASNPAEAIAIVESELDEEWDWFMEREATETDKPESYGREGPSRETP